MAKRPATEQQQKVTKKTTPQQKPATEVAQVVAAGLNWWVHKFVAGNVTSFKINHANAMAGESQKLPNDIVGVPTIEEAEQLWGTMVAGDDSNWYAHVGTGAFRSFQIDHSPTGAALNCGSYSSIANAVARHAICTMFTSGHCVA